MIFSFASSFEKAHSSPNGKEEELDFQPSFEPDYRPKRKPGII
jgi:hypothetical protein